jgi:hypothetical protein
MSNKWLVIGGLCLYEATVLKFFHVLNQHKLEENMARLRADPATSDRELAEQQAWVERFWFSKCVVEPPIVKRIIND